MSKTRAIIFIHKDKFEYYDEVQSKIFQFVFQPTVFQDLELVDSNQLNLQLKTFVTTNKLTPANILFVISDTIIFEKVFILTPATNKDLEIQKFLENIPFEHVSYKVIQNEKNYKVLAINKELYSSLQFSFESLAFKSLGVIPQSSLGDIYKTTQNLNTDIIKNVMTRFDILQKETFIQEEVKEVVQTTDPQNFTDPVNLAKPINKYRMPALISIFVLLIGVLGYVIYAQYPKKSKASPVPSTIIAPTTVIPPPSVTETPVSSPSASPP